MKYSDVELEKICENAKYIFEEINGKFYNIAYFNDGSKNSDYIKVSDLRDMFFEKCIRIEKSINTLTVETMFYNSVYAMVPKNVLLKSEQIFGNKENTHKLLNGEFTTKETLFSFFETFLNKWVQNNLEIMIKYISKEKIFKKNVSFLELANENLAHNKFKQILPRDLEWFRIFRNQLAHPHNDQWFSYDPETKLDVRGYNFLNIFYDYSSKNSKVSPITSIKEIFEKLLSLEKSFNEFERMVYRTNFLYSE